MIFIAAFRSTRPGHRTAGGQYPYQRDGWAIPDYIKFKSVFWHFRKWCRKGEWQSSRFRILCRHKSEEIACQERKSRKTTNTLFQTGRNGLPLAMSTPVAGNHHDLYDVEKRLEELFAGLEKADISVDGLFINADSGFDAQVFRNTCLRHGVIANVAFN